LRAGIAVVIGGSMSGLLSALMLRRAGWTWRRRYKRKRMSKARTSATRPRGSPRIIASSSARAGMHSTDGAVIAETAVLDFLYA
jgi:hypothetical protein